jgi:hypothetical protein
MINLRDWGLSPVIAFRKLMQTARVKALAKLSFRYAYLQLQNAKTIAKIG